MDSHLSVARRSLPIVALAIVTTGAIALVAAAYRVAPAPAFGLLALATALPAMAYVAWHAHPAILLSAGIALSIFSGNWAHIGFPELIAPDRLLIVAAVVSFVLRAPAVRDRAKIELRPIHWLLALVTAYVIASALGAGTLYDKDSLLRLADRVGVVPFLLFAMAPAAFATARHRAVLLASLVSVGLYLAVTAFCETLGLTQFVFPRYISDGSLGIHIGRARGPFLEAVGNGTGIYIGLVAAVIAAATWKVPWQRNVAMVTAVLCAAALLFTLTRSVWLGGALATAVTMVAHPALRRWLIPTALTVAVITAMSMAAIPGLATKVVAREQSQGPIWDRYNLSRAALNRAEERPLLGFGWNRFADVGTEYFELGDYPLTVSANVGIHSAYLSHLAELGLVGTSLWLLSTVIAVWLAVSRRGPPELEPWRYGLLAIAIMFFVVSAFVYPYLFVVVVLWTWAGILYGSTEPRRVSRSAGPS